MLTLFIERIIQHIRFIWSIFSNTLTSGVRLLLELSQESHFHLATMVMLTFNTNVLIRAIDNAVFIYFPAAAKSNRQG